MSNKYSDANFTHFAEFSKMGDRNGEILFTLVNQCKPFNLYVNEYN